VAGTAGAAEDSDDSEYARTGLYVGASGGLAIENASDSNVDDSYAINGWVGYRPLPLFGVDLMVEHTTSDNLAGDSGGLESLAWTANARVYLGSGWIQPFALVGLGMSFGMEDEDSKIGNDADVAMRAGGGVDIHVAAGLSVVVSGNYLASFRANRHLDYGSATVGLQYQF